MRFRDGYGKPGNGDIEVGPVPVGNVDINGRLGEIGV